MVYNLNFYKELIVSTLMLLDERHERTTFGLRKPFAAMSSQKKIVLKILLLIFKPSSKLTGGIQFLALNILS